MIARARGELLLAVLGSGDHCRGASSAPPPPIMAWDGYDLCPLPSIPRTPDFLPSMAAAPSGVASLVPHWLALALADGPVVFMEPDEWLDLDPVVQGYMDVLKP